MTAYFTMYGETCRSNHSSESKFEENSAIDGSQRKTLGWDLPHWTQLFIFGMEDSSHWRIIPGPARPVRNNELG